MTHLILMGVSGSGKTTIGQQLARALDWDFVDSDDLHPTANIETMAAGQPLTDTDRIPWLAAIADRIRERDSTVIACSALKRTYRDVLRTAAPDVQHIHLNPTPGELAQRLSTRTQHFMPPTLLTSQLADLEALEPDEPGLTVQPGTPEETTAAILAWLNLRTR